MKTVLATLFFTISSLAASAQDAPRSDAEIAAIERRAVETVVWGMPAVNYDLMRQEMLNATNAEPNQFVYWGRPLDWMNQTLTPNPDTLYFMVFFDTHDGPIVLDVPPAGDDGSFNGNVVTAWQVPLVDLGLFGTDQGAGGKFALLPPGFEGEVPDGFTPIQSETYGGFALIRSNLQSHAAEDVAKSVAYAQRVQVYPLSQADNPPPTVFVDAQDVLFDSTIRYDTTFFEHLDRVVQEEPWLDRDRAMIDALATLGIVQGQPFKPDGELRNLLDDGATEAKHFLYDMYDRGWGSFYDGTQWRPAAPPAAVQGAANGFTTPDAYPLDERGMAYTYGFVAIKNLGVGQFYLISIADSTGVALDGALTYRLTVPPNVPIEQYWSATVYDRETHALVMHMDRASRGSNAADVVTNDDGSVDIWFGPEAPEGMESNWVPTDPLREFEVMFRLYGPTPELMEKNWALPDIERVE